MNSLVFRKILLCLNKYFDVIEWCYPIFTEDWKRNLMPPDLEAWHNCWASVEFPHTSSVARLQKGRVTPPIAAKVRRNYPMLIEGAVT